MRTVTMPENWGNQTEWEQFYASLFPNGEYKDHATGFGSIGRHLDKFAAELNAKEWRAIWVPGVGLSPLARVLSGLGFDVYATDISPTAIAFQQSDANNIADYLSVEELAERSGDFVCAVQDFTQPHLTNHFDVILNVKAFQGFSSEAMSRIAQVHYAALKPGRQAYFDTMNVQGKRRDVLEGSLVNAGFFIPFFESTHWYRRTLRETNIPHVFILDNPMIQRTGEYGNDDEKWKRDTKILHDITGEYRVKVKAEQAAQQNQQDRSSRLATVIYSTG